MLWQIISEATSYRKAFRLFVKEVRNLDTMQKRGKSLVLLNEVLEYATHEICDGTGVNISVKERTYLGDFVGDIKGKIRDWAGGSVM